MDALDLCDGDPGDGWSCVLPDGHVGVHKSDEDDEDDETLDYVFGKGVGQYAQHLRFFDTRLTNVQANLEADIPKDATGRIQDAAEHLADALCLIRFAIHALDSDEA